MKMSGGLQQGVFDSRKSIMTTKYANQRLATAIRDHLLNVDAVPPTAEASRLASELAQVCLTELKIAGLRIDKVEDLFASSADNKSKVRGAS